MWTVLSCYCAEIPTCGWWSVAWVRRRRRRSLWWESLSRTSLLMRYLWKLVWQTGNRCDVVVDRWAVIHPWSVTIKICRCWYVDVLQPLQIKSVIAKEGLRGYIYIEAFKQTHVKQLIDGVGNLRIGSWQQMVIWLLILICFTQPCFLDAFNVISVFISNYRSLMSSYINQQRTLH